MTRDWYKTIIVKKQGITKNKYCTHIYWDPRCSLHSPTSTKCPSQFHFSLFTFHFSLILQFTTLKALFPHGFALLLIFASASVFSSSPCTPDRAITTCDMGWTFLSPDSTGFVTGVLVEGGWEQPALLRFLANPEKIISENYCVLKGLGVRSCPPKSSVTP